MEPKPPELDEQGKVTLTTKVEALGFLKELRERVAAKTYYGPVSRERSLAITKLDEAWLWLNEAPGF